MLRLNAIALALVALSAACTTACSGGSGDDHYELKGSIAVDEGETLSGPISLDVFEVSDTKQLYHVGGLTLAGPGDFKLKVKLDSQEQFEVRALADTNGDGECTDGELWDQVVDQLAAFEDPGPYDFTLRSSLACPPF